VLNSHARAYLRFTMSCSLWIEFGWYLCSRPAAIANKVCQGSHTVSNNIFLALHSLFNIKFKNFNTISYLHFSKIWFMEHNAKNVWKTVISGKNEIWIKNDCIWNFHTFSIPNVHFGQIQYFYKVLKSNFTIQYFQYSVGTLVCSDSTRNEQIKTSVASSLLAFLPT